MNFSHAHPTNRINMNEKVSVLFSFTRFDISACHFGRANKNMPPKGAMVSQLIHGFYNWVVKSKHLSDTRIDDGGSEIYVKDVAESNGLCCIVLWNKTGSGQTALAVNRNSPPKTKGSITKKNFGADDIPGEPLYYLVDAGKECLWTLRPPMALRTDRDALERAFRFYMKTHSDYFVKNVSKPRTKGEEHLVKLVPSEKNIQKGLPRFTAKMTRNKQTMEAIVTKASRVRKLVQIVSFKDVDQNYRSDLVTHLLRVFSYRLTPRQAEDTKKVKYEIDVRLDADEIRGLIANQENNPNSRIGFVVTGSQTPIWADQTILRFDKTLSLPEEDGVFSAEDLLAESAPLP